MTPPSLLQRVRCLYGEQAPFDRVLPLASPLCRTIRSLSVRTLPKSSRNQAEQWRGVAVCTNQLLHQRSTLPSASVALNTTALLHILLPRQAQPKTVKDLKTRT